MSKFSYQVKDKTGRRLSGTVEARDEKQAARILQEKGLLVVDLEVKTESPLTQMWGGFFQRVTLTDKVNFTRQLATMIVAGLSVTKALSILEAQASPAMSLVTGAILREIEAGGSLSEALEKRPDVFDQTFIALTRAGEAGGILDNVLTRLAENLEKEKEFNSQIKGAMLYPTIVIVGMLVVGAIMIIFVVPKLTSIYDEFQADLPLMTKVLIKISDFSTRFWPVVLLALAGAVVGVKAALRNQLIKSRYDQILFKVPILGKLRMQIMLTEFTRTLGLLVGSGVLVVDALDIVRRSLASQIYQEAVMTASKEVERGFPLAVALSRTEMFPPIVPQMISVGEETGKLNEVLGKVANYFEQESRQSVKNLTTAMEPLIMVVLGVGVAFLMIAIIMPIYNLTSQF